MRIFCAGTIGSKNFFDDRLMRKVFQAHKRSYDQSIPQDYQILKRRVPPGMEHINQQRMMQIPPQSVMTPEQGPPPGTPMYPGTPMAQPHLRLLPPQMPPHPSQLLIPHAGAMIPISSASGPTPPSNMMVEAPNPPPPNMAQLSQAAPFMPQAPYLITQPFTQNYFDDSAPLTDPFVPPSYAPEMKNAVVLQPL